jgi:addiction module HigA family antidote
MIRSFACPETEKLFNDESSRRLPSQIQRVARRKLLVLHQARNLNDLRVPYANHLEALKDDRKGQHSIRVNDQWRICFRGMAKMRLTWKLWTIIKIMKTNKLSPIHPGEILREEFMKPRELSQNALARALNVPPRRINEIVLEKRGITADTALRLARYFGTTAEMWAGLQADYDLRLARYEKQKQIERDIEPLALQPAMA